MPKRLGENAVVIGCSLAGLMTARVLADDFESVTVLERDHIESRPALHKSIPQGNHVHGLLPSGREAMSSFYPNLFTNLEKSGSIRCRLGTDFVFYGPSGRAYSASGTVREPHDLGYADILLADAITPGELDHRGGPAGSKILKPAMRTRHRFEQGLIDLGRGAAVAPNDELSFDPASSDLQRYLTRDRQSRALGRDAVG